MCYESPRVPNFSPFPSATSGFRVTGHFETSARNDPKMALNTARSKVPHIVTNVTEHQMSSHFILLQPFSSYKVVGNQKCTKSPQNDLKHLKVKNALHI